jgi:hypothetical protein
MSFPLLLIRVDLRAISINREVSSPYGLRFLREQISFQISTFPPYTRKIGNFTERRKSMGYPISDIIFSFACWVFVLRGILYLIRKLCC